jgi:hypothetical protein
LWHKKLMKNIPEKGLTGGKAHVIVVKLAAERRASVPCKLNNAEAKRTHQVGAVRRVPQTEMNLSEAKSIT